LPIKTDEGRVIGLSELASPFRSRYNFSLERFLCHLNDGLFRQWSRKMHPSLRILVVEDSLYSAALLGLLLRLWGYQAVITYDGEKALAAALATPPDVVLLDIGLPGMDGCEVARQLRQLPGVATALLVAITGSSQEADVERCKEAGIDCHFLKPVDPAELKQLLAKVEIRGRELLAQ
jgi:CheY-like chemotaxis protein